MAVISISSWVKTINFLAYRFRYLLNYILIGFLSIVVELLVLQALSYIAIDFLIKVFLGFLAGMFFSFILNSKINFKVPKSRNMRTFLVFLIISSIAFALNLILIRSLKDSIPLGYNSLRFITAAIIFTISYTAHRKITFNFVKNVGVAVYLNNTSSISEVYSKIRYYADFIHIDLVDKTIDKNAGEIDLSLMNSINKTWILKKMIHIMSKKPSSWIKKLNKTVDVILFHPDIDEPIQEVIKLCKFYNKKFGLVIGPDFDIGSIKQFLSQVDFIQLMAISSLGKPGQSFNPLSLRRLNELNRLKSHYGFEIIFDGGVKSTNITRINAKYIVSSSGILASKSPIQSFMQLKTSSRYNYSLSKQIRADILMGIENSTNLEFVKSVNIVGSFSKAQGLEGASDIDIVIILDKLNKKKFDHILENFEKLKKEIQSKYALPVYINPTLGPLKFNVGDSLVFHIMIYDIESHKSHCEKSPFTCFDWQRSKKFIKKPMSEIAKVLFLRPNNFFNSRRSAQEYISEIKQNKISYREFYFTKNKVIEQKKFKEMSLRDRIEFANHILKFLMINFLKLYYGKNDQLDNTQLIKEYFSIFSKNKLAHSHFIKKIFYLKAHREFKEIPLLIDRLELFIKDFESQFNNYFYKNSKQIILLRHAKTHLNKPNSFVGQTFNPRIIPMNGQERSLLASKITPAPDLIISSPLNRAIQTIKSIFPNRNILLDSRLTEINYGLVDGKDYAFLSKNFPEIVNQWSLGKDPRFPNGENSHDVLLRALNFLESISKSKSKNILICSHNIVLRCLLGYFAKIPMNEWHKINIPHLEPLRFILSPNKKVYIDLSDSQNKEIFKNF